MFCPEVHYSLTKTRFFLSKTKNQLPMFFYFNTGSHVHTCTISEHSCTYHIGSKKQNFCPNINVKFYKTKISAICNILIAIEDCNMAFGNQWDCNIVLLLSNIGPRTNVKRNQLQLIHQQMQRKSDHNHIPMLFNFQPIFFLTGICFS